MILNGDSLTQLKQFPDNYFHSVVTDPPYGLAFMGKKWDYDVPSVELWKEVLRVLKPGGHLLSFGGTRTYHRMVVNIEDAGFEIRDQLQWIYGSGFPKSHDISKAMGGGEYKKDGKPQINAPITTPSTDAAKKWQGWGSALKPANEPIVMARKPIEGTLAQNTLKHGCGGLNIDATRIEGKLEGDPKRFGKTNGGDFVAKFDNAPVVRAEGRFPANIIFDEAAAEMLDEQTGSIRSRHGYKRQGQTGGGTGNAYTMRKSTIEESEKVVDPTQNGYLGGASRFFYVAKASKAERGIDNHHPTVKPLKLMQYLIKLVTPPGGIVLDPFCGSGTTGVAAKSLGFGFVGVEREAEYVVIAEKRIEGAA